MSMGEQPSKPLVWLRGEIKTPPFEDNRGRPEASSIGGGRLESRDAVDFLELTEEEQQMIEFRLMVGRGVRRLRKSQHLTQQQLAERIGSSQSRVAKIEAASNEVSLDLMLRGFFSAGGRMSHLVLSQERPSAPRQSRSKRSRAGNRSS